MKLREQVVNKAVQVVGIVTIGVSGGFGQLEEWRVPAGDPNWRVHDHRPGGIGDVGNPGWGITY